MLRNGTAIQPQFTSDTKSFDFMEEYSGIYLVKCLREIMSTVFPPHIRCMMSSKTFNKADKHERPSRNPCCVGFKFPLEIRIAIICLQIILSSTLIITDVREMGR